MMGNADTWPVIHAERKALAADLAGLTPAQWPARSLCGEWTVQDVTAHLTATAKIIPPVFFAKLARSGFNFQRFQDRDIAVERGSSPEDTLARFEAIVTSVKHPPGPADTWLGETIVHAEDIRRPLGIGHDYPVDAVVRIATFFAGSNLLIGAKRRIEGVTLRATDTGWSHGTGPEVAGPVLALVLAMTGRQVALDDLRGEGVATLRSRN
jgi:uncharacterized protein (TIGR03083 family)